MRGEAQAHLVETDDGFAYVVKHTNNSQGGRRVLVNEFIGSILLAQLGVATPERAFVNIDDDCVSDIGPLQTGTHFGSRYPGTPDTVAVYDFLPDALLHNVHNREHFIGALVFDQWISNTDARQAIFFRQSVSPDVSASTAGSWVAQMIDNGSAFAGSDWTFRVLAVQGLYARRIVYGPDLSIRAFEPWLHALLELSFDVLDEAVAELPPDWVRDDELALAGLLVRLYERRLHVPAMVEQAVRSFGEVRLRSELRTTA